MREVLHLDDLAVFQSEGLRPFVTLPLLVRPGERDNDTVAARFDGVEAVVPITEHPALRNPVAEVLTGLSGAVTGSRPKQPPEPAPSTPLRLWVNQRDERLYVALTERLVRGTHRVDGHADRLLRA